MSEPEQQEVSVRFDVPSGYGDDARLDVYLTASIQNATRAKVQKAIKEGRITVNGRLVKKASHIVQARDRIECRLMKPPPLEVLPEPIPLDIAFEDDDLLIVNKPAGMVVHPAYANRTGTLVNAVLHHIDARGFSLDETRSDDLTDDEVGLSVINAASQAVGDPSIRPGIVHRLDKDTSGLLVVAKNDVAHTRLAKQFAERTVRRRYQAVVWGVPDPSEGRIENYLGRDPRDRRRVTTVDESKGKRAVTHFRTIERFGHTALLEFRLETGRTHQIRIHALSIGHPVFGDPTYGGDRIRYGPPSGSRKAFFRNLFAHLQRQALHAASLGFRHPSTGEEVDFVAPIPEDMAYVIDRLAAVDRF